MPSTPPVRAAGPTMRVRSMTAADVDFAARTHVQCLPRGFFPQLGLPFLRCYYRSFVAGPDAIALIAWSGGRRLGFLVGTVQNHAHYRWAVRANGWRLALAGGGGLLRHPGAAGLFLRTRVGRYARGVLRHLRPLRPARPAARPGREAHEQAALDVAVLTHVAVTPTARSRGAGDRLVRGFESALAARDVRRVVLVTDAGGAGAGAFYERLGWHAEGDRPAADGRTVAVYSRRLDPPC